MTETLLMFLCWQSFILFFYFRNFFILIFISRIWLFCTNFKNNSIISNRIKILFKHWSTKNCCLQWATIFSEILFLHELTSTNAKEEEEEKKRSNKFLQSKSNSKKRWHFYFSPSTNSILFWTSSEKNLNCFSPRFLNFSIIKVGLFWEKTFFVSIATQVT